MRATVMYGAGDVRVENVPDPILKEPTDALVHVTSACICGSDLWPYQSMPHKFDRTIGLDETPDGYRAMTDREALKVLIEP